MSTDQTTLRDHLALPNDSLRLQQTAQLYLKTCVHTINSEAEKLQYLQYKHPRQNKLPSFGLDLDDRLMPLSLHAGCHSHRHHSSEVRRFG